MVEGGTVKVSTWHDLRTDSLILSVMDFHCRVRFERGPWERAGYKPADVLRELQAEIEKLEP